MKKTVDHLMKEEKGYKDKNEIIEGIKNYRNERMMKQEEGQTEV